MKKQLEQLHQEALAAAANYRKSESNLIGVLIRVNKTRLFEELGFHSLFSYCTQCLKLSESHSYSLLQIVRKSEEVPVLKQKIESGEIHMSNARSIVPIITRENQSIWLEKAATLSQKALVREIKKEKPEALFEERIRPIAAEVFEFRLCIPTRLEEKLRKTQDLLAQQQRRHVNLLEALENLVDDFLDRKDPIKKAHRRAARGTPVTITAQPAMKDGKRVAISAAIVHQVNRRDGGQCIHRDSNGNRCKQRRWLERHHPISVSRGGEHSERNLVTLCHFHHQRLHRGALPDYARA